MYCYRKFTLHTSNINYYDKFRIVHLYFVHNPYWKLLQFKIVIDFVRVSMFSHMLLYTYLFIALTF